MFDRSLGRGGRRPAGAGPPKIAWPAGRKSRRVWLCASARVVFADAHAIVSQRSGNGMISKILQRSNAIAFSDSA
jgi:hypothetical protein